LAVFLELRAGWVIAATAAKSWKDLRMLTDAQSIMVDAGPARLHVRVAGSGPTLVLLPGMGRGSSDLDPLASRLIQAHYRVVLPQPRGLAPSTGPLEGLSFHDLAADIAAVIEKVCADQRDIANGAAPVVVIGHAIGNRIARTVAADRPDLARLVVLLTSSGRIQPTPKIAAAMRLGLAPDTPIEARREAAAQAWFGPGGDPTPWLDGWSQELIAGFRAAAAATDVSDFWTAGTAPVLIVQGLDDVFAPIENGRLLKRDLGDRATLMELPGIGHAMPV
jgi:pimeloyl-ACP methyl ester carboxylesterase